MGGGLPAPPMGGGLPGLPMAGGLPGLPAAAHRVSRWRVACRVSRAVVVCRGGPRWAVADPAAISWHPAPQEMLREYRGASVPAGNGSGNVAARGPAGNVSGSGNNYGGNSVNNYGSGNYGKGYSGGSYGDGYYGNGRYWGAYAAGAATGTAVGAAAGSNNRSSTTNYYSTSPSYYTCWDAYNRRYYYLGGFMLPVMMRLNAVAAGCGSAVSRRHVTSASAAHGQLTVSRTNPRRIFKVPCLINWPTREDPRGRRSGVGLWN